jgi:hypothetical protein
MFVSKNKYNKLKSAHSKLLVDIECLIISNDNKDRLYNDIKQLYIFGSPDKKGNKTHIHKFGKWEQAKIEEQYGDINGVVVYRDKQVRKCNKCGFMEAVGI